MIVRPALIVALGTLAMALPQTACAQTRTATGGAPTVSTGPIEISGISDSRCSLQLGELPATVPGDSTTIAVPVQIDCNTAFSLYAKSVAGFFRRLPPEGSGRDPELVGYDVIWPAGLIDGEGRPIAPDFNAAGTDWKQGLFAASGATRAVQQSVMIIRLRPSAPSTRPLIPDSFLLQIEAN